MSVLPTSSPAAARRLCSILVQSGRSAGRSARGRYASKRLTHKHLRICTGSRYVPCFMVPTESPTAAFRRDRTAP